MAALPECGVGRNTRVHDRLSCRNAGDRSHKTFCKVQPKSEFSARPCGWSDQQVDAGGPDPASAWANIWSSTQWATVARHSILVLTVSRKARCDKTAYREL